MILPDFILPSRAHQHWEYSGIDSPEQCRDRRHFDRYPYTVSYCYNSRGFRDREWPNSTQELKQAIWCVGDSFTVGIGSPLEHTWPWLLENITKQRTINIGLDGASNNWIARKALRIISEIAPEFIVLHWSYISRREENFDVASEKNWQQFYSVVKDKSWPKCAWTEVDQLPQHILNEIYSVHGGLPVTSDETRILQSINCSEESDLENTLDCIEQLERVAKHTVLVHSFIPHFVPKKYQGHIESQLSGCIVSELTQFDFARDGYHYDIKTSQRFCQQLIGFLN